MRPRRPPPERARAKELADLRNCTGKPQRFSGIFRCWGAQPTDARRSLTRQRRARIPHSFRPKWASIARGRFKRRTTDSAGQEASPGPFPGSRPPSHSIRAGLASSTLPRRRQLGSASCSNKTLHPPLRDAVHRRPGADTELRISVLRTSNPGAAAQVPSARSNFNSSMRKRRRSCPIMIFGLDIRRREQAEDWHF